MAQLDPLGIMDADLDSCVPTDIITSSDKLGEELRPPGGSRQPLAGSLWSQGRLSGLSQVSFVSCAAAGDLLCSSGAQNQFQEPL